MFAPILNQANTTDLFWRRLCNYKKIHLLWFSYEELFSETSVGCTASYLIKLYDVPVGVLAPSPEGVYSFICGRRMVIIVRYWMICLVHDNESKLIYVRLICIKGKVYIFQNPTFFCSWYMVEKEYTLTESGVHKQTILLGWVHHFIKGWN